MERWIRIHQTRFVVEALRDSPHKLAAGGFDTEEELEKFMRNHCVEFDKDDRWYPTQPLEQKLEMSGATTLIGIDTSVMTILCSIAISLKSAGARALRPKARVWANLSDPIIDHVESIKETRPDLCDYLARARKTADVALVEGIIYE
jgi:hypothetical protein